MTPNHAIFRKVFEVSQGIIDTYDTLPDAQASYPFAHVGEQVGTEESNNDLVGELTQTIHIFATRTQRSKVDDLFANLLNALKTQTAAYEYHIDHVRNNQRVINDNSDTQPLIHYVLDIRYSYTKKGN